MDTKLPPQQPIALVGRSLRFPGASSISELWDLLRQPRDLLQDVPPLRMNLNGYYHPNGDHDGTTNVRQSYFVKQDHRVFDAPFFHISPVEAEAMDPQQRILLELVYEALESAGMTIDGLQGSRTSVFVGVMSSDFASIQQRDEDNMPAYAVTGGATSILSNRISYFYDWKGASMTIDTACSSSLVAVHQAVQSLRNGESEMAVVAGTNLMLTPEPFIMESKLHMLSPNSQSAMWDAQANGYVRGEGFAVIILKALDQAVRNRDPIRSIIRESLVNTDGRTTGLTVPSSSAQASLIKATYQRAGLDCQLERDRCQYFEAHGTGTPTGDPVEAEAIATAFFPAPNPEPPAAATLYVGSIKTVVGHLEGCAGLAGLLKASLAVERGVIFPNLHFHTLNPAIKPFYRNLEIPIAVRPWPELPPGLPRRASVNSFGFGGANAHVILESYRQTTETPFNSRGAAGEESLPSQSPSPGPFVVSARSQTALLARVNSLSQHLQSHPPPDLGSLGAVLQSHRTVFSHRASFYSEKMKGNGSDNVHASLRLGGAQWPQMGRELILTSPVFAQTLADPPSWSLRQELTAESDLSRVSESEVAQPLCTAVQIGLVDVLRCAGIGFYKVVGYLSASDAIRVSYYRGLHVRHALQLGAMAALCRSKAFAGRVVIAASNSSSNVTLSGDADAIQEVIELLGETTTVRRLRVNRAYHSHHMIPVAEPYLQSLRACNIKVRRDRPHCIWISSVTPDLLLSGDGLEGPYWAQNLVQPVLFELAVKTALRNVDEMERLDAIVETVLEARLSIPYCAFLQRQRPAGESFARGLGELWVHLGEAAGIDFPGYRAALNPLLLEDLPAYPWDHQRVYWKESRVSINARLGGRSNHSLLGRRRPDDSAHEMRWRNILRLQDLPWLRGHSFQGETLLPAAGYVSMAFQAGQHLVPGRQVVSAEIHELEISHALVLRDDAFGMETTFGLQVVQRVDADTLTAPSAETQVNARGKIQISTAEGSGGLPPRDMATHSMLSMDVDRFYSTLAELGLGYTGPFSALNKIWRTTNMSTAHASWASSELDQSMLVHPAVLDTGFQAIFASAGSIFTLQHPYLPTKIDRIRIGEPPIVVPKQEEYVHMVANSFITKISRRFPDLMPVVRADVDVYSDHHYSLQVEGLTLTPISAADPLGDRCLFYQTVWDDDISNQPIKGLELIRQDERLLDDTELPELLERISHVYLRELYAKTPREKIPTFAWYHQRLFEYLDDTFACIDKGRHPVIKQEWTKDTRQQLFAELVRFPETIDLICANAVAENFLSVLEQKISMLQVLAADDRLSRLYDEGLVLDRGYSYIGLMAKRISHRYPRLKLFEIGAGTGATTRRILESMEGAFTSYTYTDISNGFFEKAKTRFVKHASKMEFRTFNVEKDPAEQGLSIHTYDVVIASGVLHATRCMRETLANTRRLLKPGGYLLLLEPTGSSLRVAYLMCGLPGWWLGGDDGRRLHPGLTPIQWDASLKEAGFSGVDTLWSDSDEPTKHVYSAILTQAVDERVMMIREPLSAMDSLPDITQLLIIGGNTLPVFKLLGEISALLHNWLNRIVRVASIEELSSSEPTALDGATVLCLSELDQPVFRSMTTETFQGMQRLFSHAKQVLWVTQGCLIKALLPANVDRFVQLETCRDDSVGKDLSSCLPDSTETVSLAHLFPDNAGVVATADVSLIGSLLDMVIREALTIKSIHLTAEPLHILSANSLADIPSPSRTNIVDWREQASYPIIVQPVDPSKLFSNDKTYLLVGLTGDLGQSLARWMVRHGSRHLVLSSRRGVVDAAWLEDMRTAGANISVRSMDIGDSQSLRSLLSEIQQTMPPIAGVVNGAMVLADAPFTAMTFQAMADVLKPKMHGSQHLDDFFRGSELDFFILLSSVSAVVGFPGQSNYAAANMFMKGLAARRRSQGLVGSVLDIGMLTEIGYVARAGPSLEKHLRHKFYCPPISEPDFHQLFVEAIQAGRPDSMHPPEVITGVQKLRESQLLDKHSWMYNPRFSHLFLEEPVATQQATSLHSIPISQQLANAETTEDAVMILQAEFIHRLATILQLSPSDINPQAALVHVGIDSLIAIELRSWFMKEVGVDIPALRMLSGSNTLELCEDVIMNFGLREDCEKSQSDLGKPEEQAKTQNIVMAVVESGNDAESMACSDYSEAAFASMNSDNRATDSADNETQSERSNSNGYLDITHDKKQIVLNEAVRDDLVYSEPMSYSQSRQWFLVASSPAPARYNVVLAYDIDGPLSIAGLQLAFQAVISRHQAFRTCFYMQVSTGKCMQGILQRSKAVLNCKMSTNDDDILEEFDHMRNHEFQLEQGDVFRATLMQRSQSQNTLIFGYSHILMDGTSVFLFLEDLNRAYRNEPWKLPVSPYTDFALSQRTLVENDSHRQELDYWKKSLLPLPPVLPLLDICRVRSRPTTPAPYGTHTVHASISESDVLRLKKLCQDLGITAFHFHLTVLRFLLTKFLTATNDYCIGIADANRIDHAFLRTIGNFFNLLPLRFSRQVGQSFQDAAKDTSRQSLLALSNSRLPFELLLEALNIPRSTSNTPLFQVFMNYRMAAFQHLSLGDCRMRHRAICDANIGYDLLITVTEPTRTSSVVSLTVRDDLYTQASAQLLLDAYRNLLNQFIQDPSQPLESCTLYSEMDVRSGINLGQGSQQECRLGQKTLVRHVEDWTSKTPGKIAVKDLYGNLLSFKALSHQSRTIAGILSTAGVTKASYVAVLMHPCSTTIAAILAILRLGAIYVPLDLGNPLERLIMIVRDCNPTAVLCQQNTVYLANKMATDGSVIVLNQLFLEDEDEAAHRDDSVDPDQPAFAFYTSGSTGTPKGVLISQANFLHAVDVTVQAACTTDKDVILQQSSLGFDLSLYQIIHSLACGATLIIAPPALRRNPRELAKLMLSEQVSITIATPSEYSIMLSYGMPNLQRCAKWRVAASSGENMTVPVKQLFSQLNSPILAVQNWFGPTEVGVYAINPCVRYQTSGETDLDEYPSIQPAPNVQVYIVDQDLQAVAPGFPGEICVGGPSTAQGYIGDHELTCQKFIRTTLPDVNHGLVENRVYRSGDKGRLLQDGTMVFLGRIQDDTMLKLHGFRIDLGELTTAILRTAGESLVDATATIRGNTPFLVAFVVFAPGRTPPDASASLADLARNLPLPDYMRPSVILPVPALPTTPNGKRDRVALDTIPLPVIGGVVEELPLSDVETALKDLWLQTLPGDLSTARITKDTSFFHVGGSSILLLKLQALVEKTFSVEITVMRLFQSNTLGDMAARIEAKLQYKHENTYLTTEIPQDQYPITEHSSNWDDCDYTASLPPLSFDEEVDWEEETIVHETVRQPITLASRDASYTGKTILLTGSTGLLGRALLARLVDDPLIRKIHCVAVPLLSEFRHLAKVKSYAGSLSMPTLGLSSKEAELLTQEVDIIIHASTEGSFLDSYQSIRQSTLGAVRYLASIAAPRSIPFHFLSSGRVILFTGAAGLPEISVAHFHPPTDGSEGLAAARWACERYLQNVSEALAVPVYIHRACALTSDKAPPSDVLNSIIRYTQLLKAVPILDKAEGFIDFMPLETAADEIIASIHPSSKAAQGTAPLRFIHHASGKRLTPPLLRKHFEDQEQCPFVELELTEWLRKAQALGLSDFAAAVIDSLRGREEPVFFPLLLKPPPSQNTSDSLAVRQETGATRNPTPLDMVS
ncbi:hypothetical protein J3F84DRAFT_395341 [Trichoderma pleuroticola]